MSKFPVESQDQEGIRDAVNYLLSGPGGLGQNFEGFSAYTTAYLTGNFRRPYTIKSVPKTATGTDTEYTILIQPDFSDIRIGYSVSGPGIGVGALVTDLLFDPVDGYIVTLDQPNTADIDNAVIFSPPVSLIPFLYVAPIACSSAVQIDDRTFQYNFSSAQPSPPFALGNNIIGAGWTNSFYNGGSGPIGVVKCTTTYVIIRTNGYYPGQGDDLTGGTVEWNAMNQLNSTDCNARVTVTGGTDRVFISGQLCDILSYQSSVGGDLTYTVQINRYVGSPNNDPINPDYIFLFDGTVSSKTYTETGLTGTGTLPEIQTVFSTVIDQPTPGYYWYILEVQFDVTGDLIIDQAEFNLRSLSAQVVKQ